MKHFIFPALLASVLVLPAASPAWARGFGGAAVGRAIPRSAAVVGHGYLPGRAIAPSYRFYGPAFGWGFAYDPFWYGPVGMYVVPAGAVTGGLRLEVTPKTAEVYVDGAYAGSVDDFDGHFQHLDLTPGGHHIDVGAPGFQPLSFDTYIQPDHTTDYKTTMVPVVGPNQ
jgi:hypothetical protein